MPEYKIDKMKKQSKLNSLKLEKIKITKLSREQFSRIYGATQGNNGCGKTDDLFCGPDNTKPVTPNCP